MGLSDFLAKSDMAEAALSTVPCETSSFPVSPVMTSIFLGCDFCISLVKKPLARKKIPHTITRKDKTITPPPVRVGSVTSVIGRRGGPCQSCDKQWLPQKAR